MTELLLACGTAAWIGLLTSISPCPLATNITAISFISKRITHVGAVLWAGVLYTLGRAAAYVGLGAVIVWGLLSIPGASSFLQEWMNKLLGPLLIVVGMFLLELVTTGRSLSFGTQAAQKVAPKWGAAGALLLGVVFALAMCPVTAALFFGTLIPLATRHESIVLVPLVFGAATAVPVLVFSVLLALGGKVVAAAHERVRAIEKWARRVTGVLFVGVGVYYCLTYIYGVI